MAQAPHYLTVTSKCKFWGKFLPNLGLEGNLDMEFRAYLLKCAPGELGRPFTWYGGIEEKNAIARRLRAAFEQKSTAALFCRVHKPLEVEVVWPVPSRAAEAYLFFAMAAKLPPNALAQGRLGGWTQTNADMNRLGRMLLERERRMVSNICLRCGVSGHYARECKSKDAGLHMEYACGHCNATLSITDQGCCDTKVHRGTKRLREEEPPAVVEHRVAAPMRVAPGVGARAGVAAAPAAPQMAARHVLICGIEFTSLQWFLGRRPAPRQVEKAIHACGAHAVELQNGDMKTLQAGGFVNASKDLLPRCASCRDVPQLPRCASCRDVPQRFTDTACKAVRMDERVQVRRRGKVTASRGVLWRISDLQRSLG